MKDSDIIDIAITIVLIVVVLFVGNILLEQENWLGLTFLVVIVVGVVLADVFMGEDSGSSSRRGRRFAKARQRRRPKHTKSRSKDFIPPPSTRDPLYPSTGNIKTPGKKAQKLSKRK